jgi:vitamin B12 transporter
MSAAPVDDVSANNNKTRKYYPDLIMHGYMLKTRLVFFFCFAAAMTLLAGQARAQTDEEMEVLQLFYHENDLVVTPTRTAKSITQIAENITIVTASEIEAMNAHSVADVLNTVTGVQVANHTGPSGSPAIMIQGSEGRQVQVMVDGVSQNNLSDGFPDINSMRVQHIERIEIVKGPASSAWGSSLGGVVNIITKSPDDTRKFGGAASLSIGERGTGDYRAEVSGVNGSLGYYLSGGGFLSDGLQPGTALSSGNLYSKLEWRPAHGSTVTLTAGYDTGSRGLAQVPLFDISVHNRYDNIFATLALNQTLTDELSFDFALRGSRKNVGIAFDQLSTGDEMENTVAVDTNFGGSARLLWQQERHNLIFGADVDFGKLDTSIVENGSQDLDKWALYLNDTIKLGRFSLTPGLRYDNTSTNGDFWSPSLGVTCAIADSTVLRAYGARGFSIPPLGYTYATGFLSVPNPDLKMEKVWSYSVGFETAAMKYLWLKTTYFHHSVSDALSSQALPDDKFTTVNAGKQRREGVEVEVKTTPVYHLSFTAGFIFTNAKDETTGEVIKDIPRYVYDMGILYDDSRFLRALFKGRYIDWNAYPDSNGRYSAMVWDLNLSRKFSLSESFTGEIFFTAHNLFNGAQYISDMYQNPRRWFEGGLRFSF